MGAGANAATEEMTVTKTRSFMMRMGGLRFGPRVVESARSCCFVVWPPAFASSLHHTEHNITTTLSGTVGESQCLRCG